MPVKLNIGAGEIEIEGFTPIDRRLGLEAYPLKYRDSSVDEIRASHVLEHFDWHEYPLALADWFRALKPGGKIRIAVPDIEWIGRNLSDPKAPFYLMGGQTDANDYHKSAFTRPSLEQAMRTAGFCRFRKWESSNTDCASLPCSLNIEGYKPEVSAAPAAAPVAGVTDIRIECVMSLPRLGWNDNWGCILEALSPWKIKVHRVTGAFWGQCMQNGFESALKAGADWILTTDYDSMLTARHLDFLIGTFGQNQDHIDALAALQTKRNDTHPLLTMGEKTGIEVDGSPVKVTTAHFGLTFLSADALRKVPKPWFAHSPDPETGSWDSPKRIDDDIYFWHKWREAGNTIYVDPNVRIGHLELMVSQFDSHMNYEQKTVPEWQNEQKATQSTKV